MIVNLCSLKSQKFSNSSRPLQIYPYFAKHVGASALCANYLHVFIILLVVDFQYSKI